MACESNVWLVKRYALLLTCVSWDYKEVISFIFYCKVICIESMLKMRSENIK